MRLTVVGCTGSLPGPDSAASCYLLEAEGFRLVVELGVTGLALGVLGEVEGGVDEFVVGGLGCQFVVHDQS